MLRAVSTDLTNENPLAAMHHVHVELGARIVRKMNGNITLRLCSGGHLHLSLATGRDRQRRSEKQRGEERLHECLLDGSRVRTTESVALDVLGVAVQPYTNTVLTRPLDHFRHIPRRAAHP